MITADEIASVPMFASLPEALRERLSRVVADVSLVPGEYAAHEAGERALFAVIEGRIEAVKLVDGIDRVVGERHPGDLFGEVPIVLGTVFPVGFRAAERSRVMRIDAGDYHTLLAVRPEIAAEMGRLASYRMSGRRGLQGIAAEPPPPRALVVGHRWDAACANLRHFLDRNQVSFRAVGGDTADAEELWGGPLPDEADWPAVRVIGGKTVIQPTLRRVAELLGLGTEPNAAEYDTVIIGAGPSGLAAAVYGASEGLRTIVVERQAPGGQAGTSSKIENYLGFSEGVSGAELASRALKQARGLGAETLVTRSIRRLDVGTGQVHLDGGDVMRARTIILACGVSWRHLALDGFDRLVGKGIFYGAARSEAPNAHGLDIHIVGAGNSAGQAAMFFSTHARTVTILCRRETLSSSMSQYLINQLGERANIEIRYCTEVAAAHGEVSLEELDLRDSSTGETSRVSSGGLFIFIGADAETAWLPAEIARDDRGYVLTGPDMRATDRWPLQRDPFLLETSVPGVFACGDVRQGSMKRVAAAVGEGSMAIAFVHQFMREDVAIADARAVGAAT